MFTICKDRCRPNPRSYLMKTREHYIQLVAILLIWLFHVSGIIGISVGFKEWFISKTSLNLLCCTLIFFVVFPMDTKKKWGLFGLFFFIGMFVEWLGANYSLLFGSYDYGTNLGWKLDGVPYFIGINWALLTFVSGIIAQKLHHSLFLQAAIGAALMVGLDYFMEQSAPSFDFWSFGEHVPLSNYVTWFVIAYLFQLVFQGLKIKGNLPLSLHLFLAQLVFFAYFTLFPH